MLWRGPQALATGGAAEPEDLVGEHVPRDSFLAEAQQLLDAAVPRNAKLQELLDSGCVL